MENRINIKKAIILEAKRNLDKYESEQTKWRTLKEKPSQEVVFNISGVNIRINDSQSIAHLQELAIKLVEGQIKMLDNEISSIEW